MKADITNNQLILQSKTELPKKIHNQLVDAGFDYDIYSEEERNDIYIYILNLTK